MSGAEALAVLGAIASIVSIVDGIKKVYDAAKDAQGLPVAFREVAARLLIVGDILTSAKQHIDKGDLDEDSCKGVRTVVETCEKKVKRLNELFSKAIPENGALNLKRYYRAVKTYGKGNEVESLMKDILEDVQLLTSEHDMKIWTNTQQEEIVKAIATMSAVEPSVPGDLFQETGVTNSGSGTQNNAWGENIAQGDARQYNSGGGTMTFGKN